MKTRNVLAGLAALTLSFYSPQTVLASEKVSCSPEKEVKDIAQQIPKYFRQVRAGVYLIDKVPEAKNGHQRGGELVVSLDDMITIFDRTNINPAKWYNVTDHKSTGCADWSIYLTGKGPRSLTPSDAQQKYNTFIHKVRDKIKNK